MNCEPVIEVFSLGQLHHLSQIDAGVQACLVMKDAYFYLLVKNIVSLPEPACEENISLSPAETSSLV